MAWQLQLQIVRLSASAERCAKLGYRHDGELTLYEAILTSQLHNGIVLISYDVSCGAFRDSLKRHCDVLYEILAGY